MKTITVALAAGWAILAAAAIHAQTAPESTAPAPKKYVDVAGPAIGASAKTDSKIICKRDVEIGSLVKGVRRCGTRDEWKRSEEAARRWTADIQDQKGRYQDPSSG